MLGRQQRQAATVPHESQKLETDLKLEMPQTECSQPRSPAAPSATCFTCVGDIFLYISPLICPPLLSLSCPSYTKCILCATQLAAAAFESCHTLHLACCPIYANMSSTSAQTDPPSTLRHCLCVCLCGGGICWQRNDCVLCIQKLAINAHPLTLCPPPTATPLANFVCSNGCIDGQRQLCHIIFYAHIKLTYERVHDNTQQRKRDKRERESERER